MSEDLCLPSPPPERPVNVDQQDRTLLRGVFSVRKGRTQLHKWAERQVILCGTCLTVASVKDREEGKMHILPLVGGKVRERERERDWLSVCLSVCLSEFFLCFYSRNKLILSNVGGGRRLLEM